MIAVAGTSAYDNKTRKCLKKLLNTKFEMFTPETISKYIKGHSILEVMGGCGRNIQVYA